MGESSIQSQLERSDYSASYLHTNVCESYLVLLYFHARKRPIFFALTVSIAAN